MKITDMEDNTLLGRYSASAEYSTVEIQAPLPDSVINQCVTLKISVSAVSEQYGEGEATETYTELFKSKLRVKHARAILRVVYKLFLPLH